MATRRHNGEFDSSNPATLPRSLSGAVPSEGRNGAARSLRGSLHGGTYLFDTPRVLPFKGDHRRSEYLTALCLFEASTRLSSSARSVKE